MSNNTTDLSVIVKNELSEATRCLFFDDQGNMIYSDVKVGSDPSLIHRTIPKSLFKQLRDHRPRLSLSLIPKQQQVHPEEAVILTKAFNDRTTAIREGLKLQGHRYEVYRHHPPLVYGRNSDTDPALSTGICLYQIDKTKSSLVFPNRQVYALITFQLPNTSAKMVTLLRDFCRKHLEQGGGG